MNEKLSWFDRLLIRLALAKALAKGVLIHSDTVDKVRKSFLAVRKVD